MIEISQFAVVRTSDLTDNFSDVYHHHFLMIPDLHFSQTSPFFVPFFSLPRFQMSSLTTIQLCPTLTFREAFLPEITQRLKRLQTPPVISSLFYLCECSEIISKAPENRLSRRDRWSSRILGPHRFLLVMYSTNQ
jgi:hypothetical protein